jgi:FkbM family methyltransferase
MSKPELLAIDDHTFSPPLVPPGSWALDAGCRGFALTRFLAARQVRVLAIDADPDVLDPAIPGVTFVNAALLAKREVPSDGQATLFRSHSCPEAYNTRWGPPHTGVRVPTRTLRRLMDDHGIRRFSLVKLDIEGGEYGILEELASADPPIADQISVEYHDFCHMSPTPDDPERWHAQNLARLSRSYQVVRHAKQPAPVGL